ncbi:MAG: glycerate kinase [Verrucomicrobiota bacterium]|nr:glycerate kinase [Verrucomicrobiota bacterium]
MPRRILIVPDKFKYSLSAREAAQAILRGWTAACPSDTLMWLPMSDGGDGFGPVMSTALGLEEQILDGIDAAARPCKLSWWLDSRTGRAVVETAQSNGLAQLPEGCFHPFELDTRGVGELLMDVGKAGAVECLAGIGGSATNDGGFGMARALGWIFRGKSGREIEHWTGLDNLAAIEPPSRRAWSKIKVASDVQNPLLGDEGATKVFGPQKGIQILDFAKAEACLARLANISAETFKTDYSVTPGAGAAGGLGFGLRAFADATIESGFAVFSKATGLEEKIREADLVVTAEGTIDQQTMMGKGTGQIAMICRHFGKPCIGLSGRLDLGREFGNTEVQLFRRLAAIVPCLADEEESRADAAFHLERLTYREASSFEIC